MMITCTQLHKTFGDRTIFSNFNATFDPGKIYALIGPSGSGKTTLLNMIAKLEPWDGGDILYKGKSLRSYKEQPYFEKELGYLFQNMGLLESESIGANLDLGFTGKKMTKEKKRSIMQDTLNRIGLSTHDLSTKIYTLSGGEAQRIALGRLMIKKPPILLADEPTASLDPNTAEHILDLLFQLRKPERLIILATHQSAIWERCDAILSLS